MVNDDNKDNYDDDDDDNDKKAMPVNRKQATMQNTK